MEILTMSVRNHLVFLRQNAGRILLDPAVNDCCKILRLSHLTRRWWGGRSKTRRYISHPVIGPEV